jgi:hypothetical protein
MNVRVLYKHTYISANHVATMIRKIPHVCSTKPYIECVVAYNEASHLCAKFADITA